jgi:hypothetical protein
MEVEGRTTGVVVDINPLLEQRMLAVWRSSSLQPPPPTPSEVDEKGDLKERAEVEEDNNEKEEEQGVLQLKRFLDALPQEATELTDYNLTSCAAVDGDTLIGRGEGHMEAVCLSDWVFGSSGPHACLSFLDRHAHAHAHTRADADADDMLVVQADNPDGNGDGGDDDADKQALFNWLGGALVRVNRKRVWQDFHYVGGRLLANHLVERLRQALRKLAAGRLNHADGGGGGGGGGDTERTALVLIECLRFLCTCRAYHP